MQDLLMVKADIINKSNMTEFVIGTNTAMKNYYDRLKSK